MSLLTPTTAFQINWYSLGLRSYLQDFFGPIVIKGYLEAGPVVIPYLAQGPIF